MAAIKRKSHIHRYHKKDIGWGIAWACSHPTDNCSSYMPPYMGPNSIDGYQSLCWSCGRQFKIDSNALSMDYPTCLECRTGIKAKEVDDIDKLSDELGSLLAKMVR